MGGDTSLQQVDHGQQGFVKRWTSFLVKLTWKSAIVSVFPRNVFLETFFNNKKSCEICKHQSDVNDVILVSFLLPFEHISHLFQCFYCWLEKVNVSWLSSFEYIRMQKFEETESKLRSSNCNFRITEIWITHNVL